MPAARAPASRASQGDTTAIGERGGSDRRLEGAARNQKAREHLPRAQFEASISSDYSDPSDMSSAFRKIFSVRLKGSRMTGCVALFSPKAGTEEDTRSCE
jgi:hypothetical protein